LNKFFNQLNNIKAGRAKVKAYGDGGTVDALEAARDYLREKYNDPEAGIPTKVATTLGLVPVNLAQGFAKAVAAPARSMIDPNFDPESEAFNMAGYITTGGIGLSKAGLGPKGDVLGMGVAPTQLSKFVAPVKVGIQSPELIQATKDVAAGKPGARESRDALAAKIYTPNPITKIYDLTPEPQLAGKIKDKLFKNRELPAGTLVDVRPDINSAKGAGNTTRAVTFHTPAGGEKPGKSIGYDSHALLDNFKVIDAPNTSFKIATGQSKEPSTRLSGSYTPTTQAEAKSLAESFLKDPAVKQAAFNPHIHGYAFELESGNPITGGGQVLMYGHKMFVKDPVYGDPKNYKYAEGGAVHQRALGAKLYGG
jgi:hypothetical protein